MRELYTTAGHDAMPDNLASKLRELAPTPNGVDVRYNRNRLESVTDSVADGPSSRLSVPPYGICFQSVIR